MVLADELPPPDRRKGRWIKRIVVTAAVLGGLFVCGLILLSRVGGSDENLRIALETMIGRMAGGYPVQVETLHGVSFFPYVRAYAEGVRILPHPVSPAEGDIVAPEAGPPLMTIGMLMFSRNFWDSFLWRNRFEGIRLERIGTAPGFLFPQPLKDVDLIVGADIFEGGPGAILSGFYGPHRLDLQFALLYGTHNHRPVFGIADNGLFVMSLGPLTLRGRVQMMTGQGLIARIENVTMADAPELAALAPLQGVFTFGRAGDGRRYGLTVSSARSAVQIRYETGAPGNLAVTADKLDAGDIDPLLVFAGRVIDLYRDDAPGVEAGDPLSFTVKVADIVDGSHSLGHLTAAGTADEASLEGRLADGVLSGTAALAGEGEETRLDLDFAVTGYDYARLSADNGLAGGRADAQVTLTAAGPSFGAIWRNLGGAITVKDDAGRTTARTISLRRDGLLKNMAPEER